ncbi:MAG: serine hydrolase [Actinobacteria bacterium]|nr:serine hydrolase [Actinomycetota bacterium]
MIPVYSISKPFLAQAVLELAFPIHQPIGKFLPGLDSVYSERLLEQLLNHISGLGSYGELPDYQSQVDAGLPAWPAELLLKKCLNISHDKAGFSYSNLGYELLRMLVEQETGLSYFEALQKLVFDPLELTEFAEWTQVSDIVPGYDPGWVYSGTFLSPPEAIAPALAKLAQYRAGTLGLNAGLIPVNISDTGFENPGYNFGFMTDGGFDGAKPKFVGHGGSGPGYELFALVSTSTWESELEYTTENFEQSEAIKRLKSTLLC